MGSTLVSRSAWSRSFLWGSQFPQRRQENVEEAKRAGLAVSFLGFKSNFCLLLVICPYRMIWLFCASVLTVKCVIIIVLFDKLQ